MLLALALALALALGLTVRLDVRLPASLQLQLRLQGMTRDLQLVVCSGIPRSRQHGRRKVSNRYGEHRGPGC